MSGELIELATIAALVGAVPDVEVISVQVKHDSVYSQDEPYSVPVVSVYIHAGSTRDARHLLDVFDLFTEPVTSEETHEWYDGRPRRRCEWTGWLASASYDVPVSVQVLAFETVTAEAVPADPADADLAGAVA